MIRKIILLTAALGLFSSAHAGFITHTNHPTDIGSYNYINFSHTGAYSSSFGPLLSLELDLRVQDVDHPTDLQALLGGSWTTVGSFGTGPSVWKWYTVGLGATVMAELTTTGSLNFRFNEAQSASWYAVYDQSNLIMEVPAPATLALIGLGLRGFGLKKRKTYQL